MFNLLTTFHLGCSKQRWSDFLFCLSQNLDNSLVDEIFLALETDPLNKQQQDRLDYLSNLNKRVAVYKINHKPTFKYLFSFCNNTKSSKWIISNADIYFPKSNVSKLELLAKKITIKSVLFLQDITY